MKNRGVILMVVGLSALSGVASNTHAAALIDPPRVEWGCELPDTRLKQGITAGLIGRGWVITSNNPGKMVAQVNVRGKHTLVVDIIYSNTAFDVNYKSSDNLKYKQKADGSATIHRNANSWMANIQKDIMVQLSQLCYAD